MAWINLTLMLISGVSAFYWYARSVQPAQLSKKIGPKAYKICAKWRKISLYCYLVFFLSYLLYYFFPLSTPFPRNFAWSYLISVGLGVLIGIPSFWILYRGIKDAGDESLIPHPEHELFTGIYQYLRHPQIQGEYLSFWTLTFIINSPFLSLLNFLWAIPIALILIMEEKDLSIRYGQAYEDYRRKTGLFLPKKPK